MDSAEYDRQLHQALGVFGPAGTRQVEGVMWLIYRLPDGSCKDLPTPQSMTEAQRVATLVALRIHLGIIETKRRHRRAIKDS